MDDQLVTTLMALFGILVSLLFSWVPGLRERYAHMDETRKRLVMLGVLAAATLLIAASSCLNLWVIVTCDKPGLMDLAKAFGASVVANQTTFLITPKPADVGVARNDRRMKGA